jgi:hypothetical protein
VIDGSRHPISIEEMRVLAGWTYGREGELLVDLWRGLNSQLFENRLAPLPILMPSATSYGAWIGRFTLNEKCESLSIELKRNQSLQCKANVLIHEMCHQALGESGSLMKHNGCPWCELIMGLTREIWGIEIWASPSVPRKVNGKSRRIQKPSPDGKPSIVRNAIAQWPQSLGLTIPMERFIEEAK